MAAVCAWVIALCYALSDHASQNRTITILCFLCVGLGGFEPLLQSDGRVAQSNLPLWHDPVDDFPTTFEQHSAVYRHVQVGDATRKLSIAAG